ncbi:MAG TPA: hypothetical protein VFB21_01615 [Chthonomonadaceae bacterium]|nr:hypothetical protein [Chthonomonadaceae bacterium]
MISEATILRVQDEVRQIVAAVEEITGLPSRWSGRLNVVSSQEADLQANRPFSAKKEWNCHISIVDVLVNKDERWRSLIHEALHSVSVGHQEQDYRQFRGWEEGVVEWLQRRYRPDILNRLGLSIPEETFARAEATWLFNPAIEALQRIAAQLPMASELAFFETLLKTPLKDRLAFVQAWGMREAQDPKQFMRVLAASSGVLRR